MGKRSSAPAPDPQIGEAAKMQAELGKEWLTFAREQFDIANERQGGLDDLTKRIQERQLATADRSDQWSQEDRQSSMKDRDWALGVRDDMMGRANKIRGYADEYRGWAKEDRGFAKQLRSDYDKFRPVNDKIVNDAMTWDSEARLSDQAAQARAGIMANSDMARQQQQRQMASMGINPNSGRFQAGNRATAQQAALASAAAQNVARDNARQQAVGMRQAAGSLGQNILGQSQQATSIANSTASLANQTDNLANSTTQIGIQAAGFGAGQYNAALGSASMGLNASGAALGGQQSTNQMANANANIMGQGYRGAMQGYNNQAGILNQQYSNQLQAWSANQKANAQGLSGLMGAAGTAAGLYLASSKDAKTNKRPVEGSALEAIKGMPVESWDYKPGMGDGGSHIGPYAEDFQAATGQGDGKTIPVQDMLGLQLKAIQELGVKIDKLEGGNNRRPTDIVQEAVA